MNGRALVGHTGFVGGNLLRQTKFDELYNSANIEDIRGRRYSLVVCAGARAEKWKANRDPEQDLEGIRRLIRCLDQVSAGHVVLVSTVDVYAVPVGVDESSEVDEALATVYGRHRRILERFIQARFDCTVVRLPGLYGEGLKKNVIYDLLYGNLVDQLCPDSIFQFYDLQRLWADVDIARSHCLSIVNLVTEPVSVREVAREAFGLELQPATPGAVARYDVRTRHAARFGGADAYLLRRDEVLAGIRRFVAKTGYARP